MSDDKISHDPSVHVSEKCGMFYRYIFTDIYFTIILILHTATHTVHSGDIKSYLNCTSTFKYNKHGLIKFPRRMVGRYFRSLQ